MFLPSLNRYTTRSHMALDIPLRKTNIGQKSLSFLGPKIWTRIKASLKSVGTTVSFTHGLKKEILKDLQK